MPNEYPLGERRKFKRLKLNLTVIYRVDQPLDVRMKIGDREIEAATLDLSEAGMSFVTREDIPLETILFIKFTLFKVDKSGEVNFSGPMEIIAEVRSNILLENDNHRLGIYFSSIEEKDKAEIVNFIETALKRNIS